MLWIIPVIVLAVLCVLYRMGYLSMSCKSALTFIGSIPGKGHISWRFTKCNGWVRRMVRVKESANYRFCLGGTVTKGAVQATLTDGKKFPLLTLTEGQREGSVYLEANAAYRLQVKFLSASGDCSIRWEN